MDNKMYDPVAVWKRASPPSASAPSTPSAENVPIAIKTLTSHQQRLGPHTAPLWTAISQLPVKERPGLMHKIIAEWPYRKEYWPMMLATLVGPGVSLITAAKIAAPITADLFLLDSKVSFFETVKRCPKGPLVISGYTAGIMFYVFNRLFVVNPALQDSLPCPSCLIATNIAVGIGTGVVLPLIATPYLAYSTLLRSEGKKSRYPVPEKLRHMLLLMFETSKVVRNRLPMLMTIQLIMTITTAACMLWARNRMFATMDADPELVTELMLNAQTRTSWSGKLQRIIDRSPMMRAGDRGELDHLEALDQVAEKLTGKS